MHRRRGIVNLALRAAQWSPLRRVVEATACDAPELGIRARSDVECAAGFTGEFLGATQDSKEFGTYLNRLTNRFAGESAKFAVGIIVAEDGVKSFDTIKNRLRGMAS